MILSRLCSKIKIWNFERVFFADWRIKRMEETKEDIKKMIDKIDREDVIAYIKIIISDIYDEVCSYEKN